MARRARGPNSHFYTADAAECEQLKQTQQTAPATGKRWNFEEVAFAVRCRRRRLPADAPVAVYRAYNNGFERGKDSNHRSHDRAGGYQEWSRRAGKAKRS
jgi:hypothetical protein